MPHTTRCRSGVRGSAACPCDANRFYGGNTSFVALEAPGHEPIVFDLGTGLRFWGATMDPAKPFRGSALLTHMPWDHVQGLPFFSPLLPHGARLDVYGPPQADEASLGAAFKQPVARTFFPVRTPDRVGSITTH